MISSFCSRGAQLASASEVSQSPSRWMPPVTATGSATSTAATMVAGTPRRFATCPPRRHEEAFRKAHQGETRQAHGVDPKSVQADFGTGDARERFRTPRRLPLLSSPCRSFAFHPHGNPAYHFDCAVGQHRHARVHARERAPPYLGPLIVAHPIGEHVDGDHHRIRSGLSEPFNASEHLARHSVGSRGDKPPSAKSSFATRLPTSSKRSVQPRGSPGTAAPTSRVRSRVENPLPSRSARCARCGGRPLPRRAPSLPGTREGRRARGTGTRRRRSCRSRRRR